MYGWVESANKAESIIMAEEIMKNIGIDYIIVPIGRNKGYINLLCKSCIRDVYQNMN